MKRKNQLIGFSLILVVMMLTFGACSSPTTSVTTVPDDAIIIVATVTIKDAADQADIEKALFAVVDGTRTEEGNISYVLHQDINNPLSYTFIEVWKSKAAIEAHNASAHFKAFSAAVSGKTTARVTTAKKIR